MVTALTSKAMRLNSVTVSYGRRTEPPLCRAGPVKKLLERERELAVIEELLGRQSGALAIEVGIGVGKTSLVQAACRYTPNQFG
jgi:hypothetical protein